MVRHSFVVWYIFSCHRLFFVFSGRVIYEGSMSFLPAALGGEEIQRAGTSPDTYSRWVSKNYSLRNGDMGPICKECGAPTPYNICKLLQASHRAFTTKIDGHNAATSRVFTDAVCRFENSVNSRVALFRWSILSQPGVCKDFVFFIGS